MPRLIDAGPPGPPMALDEAVAALEALRFDPEDAAAWDEAAPILARLSANREFLGDIAVAALRENEGVHVYGPQVLMLYRGRGAWFLRANMWPAEGDALLRASGRAAFFYDLPHDHNFSFLTIGHHGPGYESDYWEYDDDAVIGLPGEAVALRFAGRQRLSPGKLMLYRAHRDIHDQKPPAAFSVSLNLMESSGREPWRDQYRFAPARGRIDAVMSATALEALIGLAAYVGGGGGRDLVEHVARRHPVDRIRFGAVRALAGAADDDGARIAILEKAAARSDPYVSLMAARALAEAPGVSAWAAFRSETDRE
ncbi:MAG TPA: transposase [Sphingomonas sp.]